MAKLPARDNECVQGQRDTGFGWPHSSHCACNLPDPDLPWVKQGCCLLRRWRIVLIVCILASQNNSCDQNLNLCLELIEQVAKVQGQLFGILTTAAQEGENGHGFHIVLPSFLFVCVCPLPEWVRLNFPCWLDVCTVPGGHNEGVETIKSRLLPWLEASFTAASMGKPVDSKVPSLQVRVHKANSRFSETEK